MSAPTPVGVYSITAPGDHFLSTTTRKRGRLCRGTSIVIDIFIMSFYRINGRIARAVPHVRGVTSAPVKPRTLRVQFDSRSFPSGNIRLRHWKFNIHFRYLPPTGRVWCFQCNARVTRAGIPRTVRSLHYSAIYADIAIPLVAHRGSLGIFRASYNRIQDASKVIVWESNSAPEPGNAENLLYTWLANSFLSLINYLYGILTVNIRFHSNKNTIDMLFIVWYPFSLHVFVFSQPAIRL